MDKPIFNYFIIHYAMTIVRIRFGNTHWQHYRQRNMPVAFLHVVCIFQPVYPIIEQYTIIVVIRFRACTNVPLSYSMYIQIDWFVREEFKLALIRRCLFNITWDVLFVPPNNALHVVKVPIDSDCIRRKCICRH